MEKDRAETGEHLKNIPIQTEDIAFKPEEMIGCGKCARTNPPNRLKCVYCGAELEISAERAANIQPFLRKLENWEKGWNLIYAPSADETKKIDLAAAATILRLEPKTLGEIRAAKNSLPVARVETEKEAGIVAAKLGERGFDVSIVSDEALAADKLPVRLRGLEFAGEKIVAIFFNRDEIAEIPSEDLILIVAGGIFERKTEFLEKRKKGESKILDSSETASDEILTDIYSRADKIGYRIAAKGFDYSCLGAEKKMTAVENMRKLVAKLGEFAPAAKYVGDYLQIREVLGSVWEIEQKKDSHGLKRHSFGKFDFSNVATSNNAQQFTKYSRLQRHVL